MSSRSPRRWACASPARAADGPDARLFAAHALALRAAGVAGEPAAADVLAGLPGAGSLDGEALAALWRPFFANAIVKLGRLRSPGPAALYYDPLLDVAVVALWERRGERYAVASARALPGERLADPAAEAVLRPPWMAVDGDPAETLVRTAAARLGAFGRMHPAETREAGRADTAFAADAADLRAALPRLAWNAALRLEWAEGTPSWLPGAAEAMEAALGAGDAAALRAAAPGTDPETAAALADLPPAFAAGLALDMALETGGPERLLVASLPDDGDVYVMALCRLEGDACALRRLALLSLLPRGGAGGAVARDARGGGTRAGGPVARVARGPDVPGLRRVPGDGRGSGGRVRDGARPTPEEGRYDDEGPVRRVTIAAPFAVGKYEVTFAQWDACAASGGCGGYRPDDEGWGRGDRPATDVSWVSAKGYVRWLSEETGKDYRLLSEAEWEYAAPAGSFAANGFGLHDMHGNVWEWVEDCWNDSYRGAPSDGSAWMSGDCSVRVLRGGSGSDEPRNLRSTVRDGSGTGTRYNTLGFRVARTLAR